MQATYDAPSTPWYEQPQGSQAFQYGYAQEQRQPGTGGSTQPDQQIAGWSYSPPGEQAPTHQFNFEEGAGGWNTYSPGVAAPAGAPQFNHDNSIPPTPTQQSEALQGYIQQNVAGGLSAQEQAPPGTLGSSMTETQNGPAKPYGDGHGGMFATVEEAVASGNAWNAAHGQPSFTQGPNGPVYDTATPDRGGAPPGLDFGDGHGNFFATAEEARASGRAWDATHHVNPAEPGEARDFGDGHGNFFKTYAEAVASGKNYDATYPQPAKGQPPKVGPKGELPVGWSWLNNGALDANGTGHLIGPDGSKWKRDSNGQVTMEVAAPARPPGSGMGAPPRVGRTPTTRGPKVADNGDLPPGYTWDGPAGADGVGHFTGPDGSKWERDADGNVYRTFGKAYDPLKDAAIPDLTKLRDAYKSEHGGRSAATLQDLWAWGMNHQPPIPTLMPDLSHLIGSFTDANGSAPTDIDELFEWAAQYQAPRGPGDVTNPLGIPPSLWDSLAPSAKQLVRDAYVANGGTAEDFDWGIDVQRPEGRGSRNEQVQMNAPVGAF